MDFKESERYFQGYIFVPCCTKECYQNQSHRLQEYTSLYPSLIPKYEAFFPERAKSVDQAPHPPKFPAHEEGGYRFIFPAIQKDQTQRCKISRHNGIDAGGPLLSSHRAESCLKTQRDWKIEAGCKPKRNRTIFTADQLERLEEEFDRQQYIVGTQRFYLATDLGLNETQVKVWFQNRRIKWRRQNLESVRSSERNRFEVDGEERRL